MKSIFALAFGALLAWSPFSARAQGIDLELSPFAGGAFFLRDGPSALALEGSAAVPAIVEGARFEDAWGAGATAGVRFNDWFALEGLLTWIPTWLIGTNFSDGTDVYAYMYGVGGVLHVPLAGPIEPYAGAGMGGATYDYSGSIRSHSHWMSTFVAGLSYDLGNGRSIRVQARDFLTPFAGALPDTRGGWQNDVMLTAGVSWRVPIGRRSAGRIPDLRDFDPRLPLK